MCVLNTPSPFYNKSALLTCVYGWPDRWQGLCEWWCVICTPCKCLTLHAYGLKCICCQHVAIMQCHAGQFLPIFGFFATHDGEETCKQNWEETCKTESLFLNQQVVHHSQRLPWRHN